MTQSTTAPSGRPLPGEYAPYAQADIDFVVGADAATVLAALAVDTRRFLESLPENQVRGLRYAPGKWTLKEVLGHIIDDERIFSHRAFCLARGEATPLAGFDEKVYAANADAERRSWEELLDEYRVVRAASIALFRSLPASAWDRAGEVNGYRATPRGLAFHIAGHELHHLRLIRERYLPAAFTHSSGPEPGTPMAITRINEFQAPPDQATALHDFLRSVIALILDAPGCRSCELLRHHDDPTRFAIVEVWDNIEAHQASVSRIPPALLRQAQTLFARPAQGAYYDPVSNDAA